MLLKILILTSSILTIAKPEVFTSVVNLEPLLYTKGEIIRTLGKYLELEEKRLGSVRWLRNQYESLYKAAIGNVDSFLSNPVNAYLLVKRLTTDWQTAGRLIDSAMSKAVMENITLQDLKFPDNEDLQGAASALMRLQDTYLLNTTKLANGEIAGTNRSSQLTAGDCFELGRLAYKNKDYYHTVLWMQEALDRHEQEEVKTMSKREILEYMAYSTFLYGNVRHALKLTQDIIIVEPNHLPAYGNLKFYEEQVRLQDESRVPVTNEVNKIKAPLYPNQPSWVRDYERLCRGERIRTVHIITGHANLAKHLKQCGRPLVLCVEKRRKRHWILWDNTRCSLYLKSLAEESKLYCHYTTSKSPYLLLQPIKVEILSFDPWIVMYHDILSDEDANIFKQLAHPMLSTSSKLQNPQSGLLENAFYRVSKGAWLPDYLHPRVAHASLMVEEITGLNVKTAEELYLINYGIGGHYLPHFDFKMTGETDRFHFNRNGNRMATWIYYLSDVDAGGATVFTEIGVQMKPRKGSAAFWFNLKKNGDGDLKTRHAGCPVLAGTKWIANKWFHETDQEDRRPCSLNPFD